MTDTNPPADRTAAIRARLDAASKSTTMDVHAGRSILRATVTGGDRARFVDVMGNLVTTFADAETGPLTVTLADDEDGQDATLALHARDDLAYLLEERDAMRRGYQTVCDRAAFLDETCLKVERERDAALARVEELERQLGKAEAELDEQRWYGEQLQTSIDSCSGNHLEIEEYSGGGSDEPTTAPDSEMDPFEAADDIDRRCGS